MCLWIREKYTSSEEAMNCFLAVKICNKGKENTELKTDFNEIKYF